MGVRTSAGTTIGIAVGLPATYDAAGFAAKMYATIGEVTDLGEFGKEFNLVTHNPVGDRRTIKRKGSFNEGSVNLQFALDDEMDAGQIRLEEAVESDDSYSFVVTLQSGKKYYFTAQTMSFRINVGGVDNITSATAMLEIDSDIVSV